MHSLLFYSLVTMTTASSNYPVWTVLYHMPGSFKGRGEFLRLMLEDAGVEYEDSSAGMYGPEGSMDAFRESSDAVLAADNQIYPVLYPPAIWHRPVGGEEVLVNQAGACMIYLGDQLGYAPETAAERARANEILLNAMDYIAEGRRTFHPVEDKMSYKNQKEEGDKVSKEFTKDRMLVFLYHFEKIVKKFGPSKPVAGGKDITYADFALFHVLDATAHQFDSEFYEQAWTKANVPALKEFYEHIRSRPNLQAYFKSDRCARKSYRVCANTSYCSFSRPLFSTSAFAGDSMM
jgi:glutathione S-transferase